MYPTRVMDQQQDWIMRLNTLYERLKKEPVPRRTHETLLKYENQRSEIWTVIQANDILLQENAPPEGYYQKFKEAREINKKFIDRLKLWGFDDEAIKPILDSPSTVATQPIPVTQQISPLMGQPTIATTSIHSPTPLTPATVTPSYTTAATYSLTPATMTTTTSVVSSVLAPVLTTTASHVFPNINIQQPIPTNPPVSIPDPMTQSNIHPNPSGMSWNQTMEGERERQGIQQYQLLSIITENQKEIARLAANNRNTQHLQPAKIEIPMFDGNVKLYRQFRDMFGRAVSSCNWSNIDLFMYLQSKLTGDAYRAIESLEITEETYYIAWEVLDRRFNNRRKLLESTLKPLRDVNFLVEHNNCTSGKAFMSSYQAIFNNLKQYKATVPEIIMELLLPRLNDTTRARFEDHIGRDAESQTPSVEQLDYFFEKELRIWANTAPSVQPIVERAKHGRSKVYVTTEDQGDSSNRFKCFICQKNHTIVDFEQFLSSKDRAKLLKYHKICIYCLKHRYSGRPCNSRRNLKCDICADLRILR